MNRGDIHVGNTESNGSRNKKTSTERRNRTEQTLRKMIPYGIGTFIVILLIILFFLLKNYNSPEAQANILVNAIKNNDTQRISTIFSTRDNKVGSEEADTFIHYIKSEIGLKKFDKELTEKVHNLDQNNQDASYISTPDGNEILRITKNGRRYIFFDNIGFSTMTKKAIIQPKTKTTYIFKADDRKRKVIAEANKKTMLGNFIPGDYKIPASKETLNGTFSGHITFNFKNSNSETVEAHEDFPEANLNIKLAGADKLSDKSKEVTINKSSYHYSHARLYGPYPVTSVIEVSAKGTVKGKTFKSDTMKLYPSDLKKNTPVTLHFEKDKIDKYVDEKEKEEKSLKNKLTRFFDKYTAALNTAIGANNFASVSNYLKAGTNNYDNVKKMVKTESGMQQWYQTPEVLNVTTEGDDIKAEVLNMNEQGVWVPSTYQLQNNNSNSNNSDDSDFKITNYKE